MSLLSMETTLILFISWLAYGFSDDLSLMLQAGYQDSDRLLRQVDPVSLVAMAYEDKTMENTGGAMLRLDHLFPFC